ncbi:GntR family transcriptional regulator [Cryobacterium ruanii]|uniref:GntR family transcriptional regulator n=1 Tax=Cryobacterium ruanii TaxID=1259197 RepID=A0A4R9AT56_9MICO|nr:GntR family transcriptional regulator [Cryobacterium ruanii]TFD68890.1 GntR family transcriptional regulator [Cryobacterium ruanii]
MSVQEEKAFPMGLFMDLERSGPIPLYFQVSQRIEKAILSGELPAGSRLENEVALGQRLGLSRPTVRRAIQEIVDKGLLVRRRGIGTQVVHGQVTRKVELTSLYDDLTNTHKVPSTHLLTLESQPADARISERLGVEEGSPTLHLRRVRLADDVPVAVMENWLPGEFIGIESNDLVAHGLYQVLRSRGVTMRVARQHIGARKSTNEESALLEIEKNSALLTMDRTAFDNSGRAVEFGQHCYRPDLYSFEVTLVEK